MNLSKPALLFVAVLLGGLVLWFMNPSSDAHAKQTTAAFGKKIGLDGVGGAFQVTIAYPAGTETKYNNYWFFSTVSIKSGSEKAKTASFGMLGFVKVYEW